MLIVIKDSTFVFKHFILSHSIFITKFIEQFVNDCTIVTSLFLKRKLFHISMSLILCPKNVYLFHTKFCYRRFCCLRLHFFLHVVVIITFIFIVIILCWIRHLIHIYYISLKDWNRLNQVLFLFSLVMRHKLKTNMHS